MVFLVILSIIMFFFCLYLYFNIQKLKEQITKLEQENKTILEKKLTPNKEDLISIETISSEKIKQPMSKNETKKEEDSNDKQTNNQIITNSSTNKPIDKQLSKNTYKFRHPSQTNSSQNTGQKEIKYTARTNNVSEYQKPNILPPTTSNLNKTIVSDDKNIIKNIETTPSNMTMSLSFNPDEFIPKEQKKVSNNISSTKKPMSNLANSNKYLEEISKHIADELVPQTIDLTEYEKIQEEQAIISYQELLTLKEKNNIEEKDDENFVENLKEFYSLLD